MTDEKLYRVRKGKWIAGVCGGLAKCFNVDPKVIRLLFVIFVIMVLIFPNSLISYVILMFIIPKI